MFTVSHAFIMARPLVAPRQRRRSHAAVSPAAVLSATRVVGGPEKTATPLSEFGGSLASFHSTFEFGTAALAWIAAGDGSASGCARLARLEAEAAAEAAADALAPWPLAGHSWRSAAASGPAGALRRLAGREPSVTVVAANTRSVARAGRRAAASALAGLLAEAAAGPGGLRGADAQTLLRAAATAGIPAADALAAAQAAAGSDQLADVVRIVAAAFYPRADTDSNGSGSSSSGGSPGDIAADMAAARLALAAALVRVRAARLPADVADRFTARAPAAAGLGWNAALFAARAAGAPTASALYAAALADELAGEGKDALPSADCPTWLDPDYAPGYDSDHDDGFDNGCDGFDEFDEFASNVPITSHDGVITAALASAAFASAGAPDTRTVCDAARAARWAPAGSLGPAARGVLASWALAGLAPDSTSADRSLGALRCRAKIAALAIRELIPINWRAAGAAARTLIPVTGATAWAQWLGEVALGLKM
jgi:hypothetical protein